MQSILSVLPRAADRRLAVTKTSCLVGRPSVVHAIIFLMAIASACGPRASRLPTQPSSSPRCTLGAVFQTLDNPFFQEVNAGLREIVESNGDQLETEAADWDASRQQDEIERLIAGGIRALFLNPVDPDVLETSLRRAADAGIPCVVVDTQMPNRDGVACQVLSDNREAGRLAARSLAKALPAGRIIVLHIPANEACIDRITGFREVLGRFPDVEILAVEDGGGTRAAAETAMASVLEHFPDLDGVFAANDPMALGAIAALGRIDRPRREATVIVSVDGSPDGIAAVRAGRLHATSMQFPREIGRIAAQRAYEILAGNSVEQEIRVPVELVTKENAHAFAAPGP
jgi:ribose transport system substrate-binding protein